MKPIAIGTLCLILVDERELRTPLPSRICTVAAIPGPLTEGSQYVCTVEVCGKLWAIQEWRYLRPLTPPRAKRPAPDREVEA